MKLSVIIVNYNVMFFLDQCLQSVFGALKNIDAEVFVVDNNSVDGSVSMVKEKFPKAILIENDQNLGFSKANNMAVKRSSGEYVLLLNPDTVVEEDTFRKTLAYMDDNPVAGALGIKMIDGKGNFLPESKRGLPTPWVAFYKIFGITRLFPKSKKFGKYYMTFLDPDIIHNVDVLCGAFMLIRKKVLEITGLLDEIFFMYGEDIDLSYRIQKSGYQVIYFPETTIIHYKGESTKKSSLNYVFLFYKAMEIFTKKHLSGSGAKGLKIFIHLAIYLRASLSLLKRIVLNLITPVLDVAFIYLGIYAIAKLWGLYWFNNLHYYSSEFFAISLPVYLVIWIISLLFSGAYDHPVRLKSLVTGVISGTLIILILYALLPKDFHFSRIIILFGAFWAFIITFAIRILLSFTGLKQFALQFRQHKKILIVGSLNECERVKSIIQKSKIPYNYIAFVSPLKNTEFQFLGNIAQMEEIVKIHKINEIIFCSNDISASLIIDSMLLLSKKDCDFKIAPANSESIIGSNSINTAGDLYVFNINSLASAKNIRLKRTFDILLSIVLLLLTPLWIWVKKNPVNILKNIMKVIVGRKTWIGYSASVTHKVNSPNLKTGVFTIDKAFPESRNDEEIKARLDIAYAQDYKMVNDLKIFVKAFYHTD